MKKPEKIKIDRDKWLKILKSYIDLNSSTFYTYVEELKEQIENMSYGNALALLDEMGHLARLLINNIKYYIRAMMEPDSNFFIGPEGELYIERYDFSKYKEKKRKYNNYVI